MTYHEGGPEIAATFAMGGHMAFLPVTYALMHYLPMMAKGGVDPAAALSYFQLLTKTSVEGYGPMLQQVFAKRDYSLVIASHQLITEILEAVSETCRDQGIDGKLAALMADYHRRAMKDPELASKTFTSAYEVVDPRPKAP